jgi:hypothetical protein
MQQKSFFRISKTRSHHENCFHFYYLVVTISFLDQMSRKQFQFHLTAQEERASESSRSRVANRYGSSEISNLEFEAKRLPCTWKQGTAILSPLRLKKSKMFFLSHATIILSSKAIVRM